MALDGPGLFENDAANDFVRAVESFGVREVRRALREVLDHLHDYLDVDVAAEAWVAAELLAARAGEERQRTGDEPRTYDEAIASLPVDAALLGDSLSVVDRLASDEPSETSDLLADLGAKSAWRDLLEDLRLRLQRAHARNLSP
jgi:Domain of unknown function (DUF4259)